MTTDKRSQLEDAGPVIEISEPEQTAQSALQPHFTVIVKTTDNCNMGCLYCYASCPTDYKSLVGINKSDSMDLETMKNMVHKIAAVNQPSGSTTFIWHGGEPLLLGLDFYKRAIEVEQSIPDHKFKNDIQTNGTLLTPQYLDFFAENSFHIGMSLDGIAATHNFSRPYGTGRPSFEDTFAAVLEVKKRKLGGGVICILNRNTEPHLEEIYGFFKANEINAKMNVQLPAGAALHHRDLALTPVQAGRALNRLFDLWFNDNSQPVIDIEPFTDIMGNIGGYRNTVSKTEYPVVCLFRNKCAYSFISVAPDGGVFPCGRFSDEPGFYMGNINTNSMEEILASAPRQLFVQRATQVIESCKPCDYRPICNSGCPDNALMTSGDMLKKDGFCAMYKLMFIHIEEALRKELGIMR